MSTYFQRLQVQQTEQQFLVGGKTHCKQCVMPPHDIVASVYKFPQIFHPIFTGEPGAIEQYWENNVDLLDALQMPDLEA